MIRTFTIAGKAISKITSLTSRLPYLLLILILPSANILAQTSWTGNLSTDWNTAGNWSAGVPGTTSDVTIPNVTNAPVISSAGAVARSVIVTSGGLLTVQAAASLTVDGAAGDAFYNAGTVQNNGTIIITNASGDYGINTVGIFENKTGGLITVDGVDFAGVFINGGTFTNEATIRIGSTGSVGGMGIISTSILNNTATGQIYVDRSWSTGISAHSGTVNNQGSITVGASSATSSNTGLDIYMGIFTNNGQVNLDRCKVGIVGFHQEGKFRNNGTVKIGALQSVSDLIGDDELANLTFSNNTGGVLQGTGKIAATRFVSAGGTLSPGYSPGIQTIVGTEDLSNGIMAIEVNGAGAAGTDYDQIVVNGTVVVGGTLALSINYTPTPGDQVTIVTASSISGAFSSVTGLPANWTVQYTSVSVVLVYAGPDGNIWNGSVSSGWHDAANWSLGVPDADSKVTIPDVTRDPIITTTALAKSVTVKPGAVLTVTTLGDLSINGATTQGVWNQGAIQNSGLINIGNSDAVGNYGIFNDGVLSNNQGARIKINRVITAGIGLLSNTVTNSGEITIGELTPVTKLITAINGQFNNSTEGVLLGTGEIAAANFTNAGGTLSPGYSAGIMTFNANEDFNNNILSIEVNGKETAGTDFDRVNVSGTATLGGTLSLSVNYTPTVGDQIVIVSATQVTGTFASVTGLPTGWHVVYYPSTVMLTYGVAQTTWTGDINSDWNNAGNWSSGIPDITSDVTIPDVTTDPVLGSGTAVSKSLTIAAGGLLTIENTADLLIQNSSSQGISNDGTMANKGTVSITGTGADAFRNAGTTQNSGTIAILNISGQYGINSVGTFENQTGGLITVDGVEIGGVNIKGGTFTNEATIRVGSTGSVGSMGITAAAILNNTAAGQIYVDRAWYIGMSVPSGTVNNHGSITIGASNATDVNTALNIRLATFTNNGQVNLDRCDVGIIGFHQDGKLLNNGTVKIGALGSVSDLIGDEALARLTFSNNTGGVLQGTGRIAATRFVSAGGTLSPGYSPGKQTIVGSEDLSNSIMAIEVNGTGVAGVAYDQIVVNGTATLGGTLALTFNFPTPNDGALVTIIDATALSGTFSSVTGLPEHWIVKYDFPNTGEVSLEYANNLPVTLVRFNGKPQENGIRLEWQTSEETNNQGFEIERKQGTGNWQAIGFVDGNGSTKVSRSYAFLDLNPAPGLNYYRLRQLDFDGTAELSRIIAVRMDGKDLVKLYPNPATEIINIEGTEADVKVLDLLGRTVIKGKLINQKLDISRLPAGFYIISVTSENREKSISFLKQ